MLGRVTGQVVASEKHPSYVGHKLLSIQPVDGSGNDKGKVILSMDSGVGAGPGDVVLYQQEGNCARQLLGNKRDPFHSVIVGIVDLVHKK
jgi:ethanolamine utilization protein EutN